MKGLRILVVLAVAALLAAPAANTFAGDQDKPTAAEPGKKATTDKQVTVVSVDPSAKTLTFKGPDGKEKTVPVTGQAVNKLKEVRPGQQITVTCTSDDAGEIDSISDLKLEPAAGTTRQP